MLNREGTEQKEEGKRRSRDANNSISNKDKLNQQEGVLNEEASQEDRARRIEVQNKHRQRWKPPFPDYLN